MPKRAAEHHTKAAEHHEQAARHHKEAARHDELGNREKGAHHAQLADESHRLATHHAEQAAKAHLERYGTEVIAPSPLSAVKKEMSAPRIAHSARKN